MNNKKNEVMATLNADMQNMSFTTRDDIKDDSFGSWDVTNDANQYTAFDWWVNYYYPQIIRESYPVYIRERAEDKGKQAYEIVKALNDKGLIKLDKVKDFVKAMDTVLETL